MDENKISEEKENKQGVQIFFPDQSLISSKFSDYVQVNANLESISITFVQKLPFNPEGEDADAGEVVARICLTWPHFFRFAKLINKTAFDNKEKVVNFINDAASAFSEE